MKVSCNLSANIGNPIVVKMFSTHSTSPGSLENHTFSPAPPSLPPLSTRDTDLQTQSWTSPAPGPGLNPLPEIITGPLLSSQNRASGHEEVRDVFEDKKLDSSTQLPAESAPVA